MTHIYIVYIFHVYHHLSALHTKNTYASVCVDQSHCFWSAVLSCFRALYICSIISMSKDFIYTKFLRKLEVEKWGEERKVWHVASKSRNNNKSTALAPKTLYKYIPLLCFRNAIHLIGVCLVKISFHKI